MLNQLHRYLFTRCAHCGQRFKWGEERAIWHYAPSTRPFASEDGVYHRKQTAERSCLDAAMAELHGEHDADKARMAIRRVA